MIVVVGVLWKCGSSCYGSDEGSSVVVYVFLYCYAGNCGRTVVVVMFVMVIVLE